MALANEDLFAIERLLDDKLNPVKEDIKVLKDNFNGLEDKVNELGNKITGLEDKVDRLGNKVNGLEDKFNGLEDKVNSMNEKVNGIEIELRKTNFTLENILMPNINLLIENFIPAATRYEREADKIEAMQEDIDNLKKVVAEHSEKLQRIS